MVSGKGGVVSCREGVVSGIGGVVSCRGGVVSGGGSQLTVSTAEVILATDTTAG